MNIDDHTRLPDSNEHIQPIWIEQADGKENEKSDFWLPKRSEKTEKLEALTKARLRNPKNEQLKVEIYQEVKEVIEQDPFLAYEDETEAAYKFHNHADEILIIPKERAVPEPYPVSWPRAIRKAYRFLLWAVLGLILSGLGALIFAPAAGLMAVKTITREARREDRVRAVVIFTLSLVVFMVGLALAYLFLIHWGG